MVEFANNASAADKMWVLDTEVKNTFIALLTTVPRLFDQMAVSRDVVGDSYTVLASSKHVIKIM